MPSSPFYNVVSLKAIIMLIFAVLYYAANKFSGRTGRFTNSEDFGVIYCW